MSTIAILFANMKRENGMTRGYARRLPSVLGVATWSNRILWATVIALGLLLATGAISAHAEEVYKLGADVTSPKVIYKESPNYTKEAKKAKLHGTVMLRVVVNSDGIPEDIQVEKSLDPGLDAQAVKSVSNWRFKPGEKNGKPVAVSVNIEVTFRLCCSW